MYRCMQTHVTNAYIHAHTCRDTGACLDGCTHNVDKILLKDDCEDEFHLRLQSYMDAFSNGGMALHYTNVQMLADTCTDKPAHIH